jgi:hypothetical protein
MGLIMTGVVFVLLYFIPAIVAYNRVHRQTTPIFVLNLFLGWTLVGWVVALCWAFTTDVSPVPRKRSKVFSD